MSNIKLGRFRFRLSNKQDLGTQKQGMSHTKHEDNDPPAHPFLRFLSILPSTQPGFIHKLAQLKPSARACWYHPCHHTASELQPRATRCFVWHRTKTEPKLLCVPNGSQEKLPEIHVAPLEGYEGLWTELSKQWFVYRKETSYEELRTDNEAACQMLWWHLLLQEDANVTV